MAATKVKDMSTSGGKRMLTWGDSVRVKAGAPLTTNHSGALAAVVGFREVETDDVSLRFDAPIGTKLVLVEFGDGTSTELSEKWLELDELDVS